MKIRLILLCLILLIYDNVNASTNEIDDLWQPQTNPVKTAQKSLTTTYAPYNYKRNKVTMAFHGGGIRGYIQACECAHLEREIAKKLGLAVDDDKAMPIKIGQVFDMIAGTSTGALSTLFLTIPEEKGSSVPKYSAQDLEKLYEENGVDIFSSSWWQSITSAGGVFSAKYSDTKLDELALRIMDDYEVKDATTKIFVTAFEISNDNYGSLPHIFRSYPLGDYQPSKILSHKAAQASSAAPTYFPPETIYDEKEDKEKYFIDGGMTGMNNPDLRLFDESRLVTAIDENDLPHYKKTRSEDFLHISMGTGFYPLKCDPAQYNRGRLINNIKPIIDIALSAPTQSNAEIMTLKSQVTHNNNYIYLNPNLPYNIELDDASPATMQLMKKIAQDFIADNSGLFSDLIERLTYAVLVRHPELNPEMHEEQLEIHKKKQKTLNMKRYQAAEYELQRLTKKISKFSSDLQTSELDERSNVISEVIGTGKYIVQPNSTTKADK